MKHTKFLLPMMLGASLFMGAAGAESLVATTIIETQTQSGSVDVAAPGTSTTRTTVIERNEPVLLTDADDDEVSTSPASLWLFLLFTVLAAILVMLLIASFSRRVVVGDRYR